MEQENWVDSRCSHRDWGRYMGTFDDSYEYEFNVGTVKYKVEDRRHEILFENHVTRISQMFYLSYEVNGSKFPISSHLGTYDSRFHTMFLRKSLAMHTDEVNSHYTPILNYLKNFVVGAKIVEIDNMKMVGIIPKGSKQIEDMCSDACVHHPEYKWNPIRKGAK